MIPKELIRLIVSEKVIPFIGAGFSRSFGYPGWMDLLEELKVEIGINDLNFEDVKDGDPLQIAQSFLSFYKEKNYDDCREKIIEGLGLNNFDVQKDKFNEPLAKIVQEEINKKLELDFSNKVLDLIKVNPDKINSSEVEKLKKLGDIDFNYLITTNYDKVIENEILNGKNHLVLSLGKGEELNWNEKDKTIFKIHGDIESSNGIIFTHSQYYQFMHEFGYFRSKLYTLFSSNVILMMGYGFNDINIHQTYFQFIRDYGSQIDNSKFYIVLTSYDKLKWGSYFNYYKRFLESYRINIIEAEDLPSFVEDLSNGISMELASTSLSSLFENYLISSEPRFADTLVKVINGDEPDYHENRRLNIDYIRSFNKIYNSPFILNEAPFNKDITYLEPTIGLSIFDYTLKIVENDYEITSHPTFIELVNHSLDYIDQTSDFYGIEYRLKRFISLSKHIEIEDADLEIGQSMYNMFSACHPTQYLRSNPGGRYLLDYLHQISRYHVKSYLHYILSEQEEDYRLPLLQKYWINKIQEKFISKKDIISLIEAIENYEEENKQTVGE